jgi:hypothetical protein
MGYTQTKTSVVRLEEILQRTKETGKEVYKEVRKIIEEGASRDSPTLKGFEERVEVEGREHVVKVVDADAKIVIRRMLLKIDIVVEVDGVLHKYVITYRNRTAGYAPGGTATDAEILATVVEMLTGKRPKVHRWKNGQITLKFGREHLDALARYAELSKAIMGWIVVTSLL